MFLSNRLALSSRSTYVVLALVLILVPTAWALTSKASISRHVTIVTGTYCAAGNKEEASSPPVAYPSSIPADVTSLQTEYVVAYEQIVSRPIPADRLDHFSASENFSHYDAMLIAYLQAAFESFTWMLQAYIVRAIMKDPGLRPDI